jgi:hypothetical protein
VSARRGHLKAKVQAWRTVHRNGKAYAQRFVTSKGATASAPPAVAAAQAGLRQARVQRGALHRAAHKEGRELVAGERALGGKVVAQARVVRTLERRNANAATAVVKAKRAELKRRVQEHKAAKSAPAAKRKALHARVKEAKTDLGHAQTSLKAAVAARRIAHSDVMKALKAKSMRVRLARMAGKQTLTDARVKGAQGVKAAQAALKQAKADAKRAALRKRLGVSGGASPPIAPTPAPRPAPAPPRPTPPTPPGGSRLPLPITSRMRFPDTTADGPAIRTAASTVAGYISAIHDVPATMPQMKMVSFEYLKRPGSGGASHAHSPRTRGVFINDLDIVATRAHIGVPEGQVRAVMAHEIGHALDYAINPSVAWRRPPNPSPHPEVQRNWAAREKLLNQIHATPEVVAMKARLSLIGHHADSQARSEAEHLRYLTSDVELFARAYAQHVEMHAGDRDMRLHHDAQTVPGISGHPAAHNSQWQPMTFAPVRAAFNDFFHEVGLAPSPHP